MDKIVRFYRIVDGDHLPFTDQIPFENLQDDIASLTDDHAYVTVNRMELLGSIWRPTSRVGGTRTVPLLTLDRITRDPQFRIERRRNYRPLVLGDGENLADPTFYVIYDDNVLGIARTSQLSPGPASFRDYINRLQLIDPPIAVIPLVDGNAVRALSQIGTLTRMTIGVGPDVEPGTFSRSALVADAIRSARRDLGSVTVEVTLKISAKGNNVGAEEAYNQLSGIVTSDALGYVDKAEIGYRRLEDGRADSHDFVQEAVARSVVIEQDPQTGQPLERSASEAMAEAYDLLYEDIKSAVSAPQTP